MAEDAGGEREFGRGGVGLLGSGMDEGAGSGRCRVEASAIEVRVVQLVEGIRDDGRDS